MPVAIAPVDRQLRPMFLQLGFQRRNQISILLIDRTDAAKQLVMPRDAEHPFTRHLPSAQNVFEERSNIIHSFRPTERH